MKDFMLEELIKKHIAYEVTGTEIRLNIFGMRYFVGEEEIWRGMRFLNDLLFELHKKKGVDTDEKKD